MKLTKIKWFSQYIMLNNFWKRLRDLTISAVLFSAGGYGYIYYQTKENEKQYLQAIKSQTLRDASRLSNDTFGISWGFQADDTIMTRIDSGDLLFMRFQCHQCLSPKSMIKCYLKTSLYLQEEFHTVGYAFRDETGLYVLYNQFGETKVKPYCQLVSLPYIRTLTLQKRSTKLAKAHINLRKEIDFDKQISQSSLLFVNRVYKLLGGKSEIIRIQDLLSGQQKINIRTETNNTLRSL